MDTLPVDLTQLVAATLGSLLLIIPALGLALRWAAKPLAEALTAGRRSTGPKVDLEGLKMRIEALEHEVSTLSPGAQVRALPRPDRDAPYR